MTYFQEEIADSLIDLAKKRSSLVHNNGEKIVLTSGCFDILHGGQLKHLCESSVHGFLIVGINSNASVRRLKGDSRPVRDQEDRLFVVAGLKPVGLAVIFDDDIELIQASRPDIYIASATSNIRIWDDTRRLRILRDMNIPIIELPILKEESTTQIIERARRSLV